MHVGSITSFLDFTPPPGPPPALGPDGTPIRALEHYSVDELNSDYEKAKPKLEKWLKDDVKYTGNKREAFNRLKECHHKFVEALRTGLKTGEEPSTTFLDWRDLNLNIVPSSIFCVRFVERLRLEGNSFKDGKLPRCLYSFERLNRFTIDDPNKTIIPKKVAAKPENPQPATRPRSESSATREKMRNWDNPYAHHLALSNVCDNAPVGFFRPSSLKLLSPCLIPRNSPNGVRSEVLDSFRISSRSSKKKPAVKYEPAECYIERVRSGSHSGSKKLSDANRPQVKRLETKENILAYFKKLEEEQGRFTGKRRPAFFGE